MYPKCYRKILFSPIRTAEIIFDGGFCFETRTEVLDWVSRILSRTEEERRISRINT